jgi:CRISPR system Cascade subunit CasB
MSEDEVSPQDPPIAPEAAPAADRSLRHVVSRLAVALDRELSPGTVAALRKLEPSGFGNPAFWNVVTQYLDDQLPAGGEARDGSERRWAAVLCGMATTAGLNRPGHSAGEALAEAGFSELRFDRLLRATGDRLHDGLRAAGHFLASKGEHVDWTDLARLALSEGSEQAEPARRALARTYYRAKARAEKKD